MTEKEILAYKSYLSIGSNYFEYGCGNSTIIASNIPNIKTMISVDSSYEWIAKISKRINYIDKRVLFTYINIGADSQDWGKPKDKTLYTHWAAYPYAINYYRDIFDSILIDGRFRVACSLCAYHNMNNNSILIIHDYSTRQYYRYIENYFKIIDKQDSMYFFRKKLDKVPTIDDIKEYSYIYD